MANIQRIVNIQIALRTAGIAQQNFDGLLLIGLTTMPERVRVITSADELITDGSYGLTVSSQLYKAAQVAFAQIPQPARIYIGRRNALENITDAMIAIRATNDDWYGVVDADRTIADIVALSAYAESAKKLHLTVLTSADILSSGPGPTLETNNYFRTAWWYVEDRNDDFPDVASAVRAFSILPGGETWANMRLMSVPSVNMNETVFTNVTALNGNTFEPFRNISITQNGKTAAGEWLDIIRFRDWLEEECRTRVFNQLVDNRIPYTDMGIQIIVQRLREALDLGVVRGGIAPDELMPDLRSINPSYRITYPLASNISVSDKAARILRDIKFTARLAGAIHATTVNGFLTYDNIG